MTDKALVIGGTGPTGHFIVNGLRQRGFEVAILHSGRHEVDEIPFEVEHIHTDPFDEDALSLAIGRRTWDLTIATYGRLRMISRLFQGRTGKFISIGGGPAYRGYMNAEATYPKGMLVPVPEGAAKTRSEEEDGKGFRVLKSEEVVFNHHPEATHFRYPYIYGKYQIVPREWPIVRRILDGRSKIILPDGGHYLNHHGAAQNMAHAVLCGVDRPEASRGQIYNCGDERVLSLGQVVEVCCDALDATLEIVSMPYSLAISARPLVGQPWTSHRMFDLTKIKSELGYKDIVAPVDALSRAVKWLADNPIGERAERSLQDPFDYEAEDRLLTAWTKFIEGFDSPTFSEEPGYTGSYSGPGGSVRKSAW